MLLLGCLGIDTPTAVVMMVVMATDCDVRDWASKLCLRKICDPWIWICHN